MAVGPCVVVASAFGSWVSSSYTYGECRGCRGLRGAQPYVWSKEEVGGMILSRSRSRLLVIVVCIRVLGTRNHCSVSATDQATCNALEARTLSLSGIGNRDRDMEIWPSAKRFAF